MADNSWLVKREQNALPSFDTPWAAGADSGALQLVELQNALALARAKGLVLLVDTVNQAVAALGTRMHTMVAISLHDMVVRVTAIEDEAEREYMQDFTREHVKSMVAAMSNNQGTGYRGLNDVIQDSLPRREEPKRKGRGSWLLGG